MLDLNELPKLPRYEIKLADGTVKSYDSLLTVYSLQTIEGETEPLVIQSCVNKVFDLDVDAFTAIRILEDFTTFSEQNLEEPLKKVFGRELSSTTTMDSRPENSENLGPQNTLV